jgi:hypothetical protein
MQNIVGKIQNRHRYLSIKAMQFRSKVRALGSLMQLVKSLADAV